MFSRRQFTIALPIALVGVCKRQATGTSAMEELINQIVRKEHQLLARLQKYHPLCEIYIQLLQRANGNDTVESDEYFFGRTTFGHGGVAFSELTTASAHPNRLFASVSLRKSQFLPRGFVQMALMDNAGLDPERYDWEQKRQEFLGEVRCWVFDVKPKKGVGPGRFIGRIWAAEKDLAIVRFDGTYTSDHKRSPYFHFNSWRVNRGPDLWLPASIYIEETDLDSPTPANRMFKARVSLWAYEPPRTHNPDEFTAIRIESGDVVPSTDSDKAGELPRWRRLGEGNVLEWLQTAGMLAPIGKVEKVLETVVNNILISNDVNYQWPINCRVLLTMPLESFTINNTIVLSRGLIDVLPDEASLALVLARELAHIVLGHRVETKYSFNDRILVDETEVFKTLSFHREADELGVAEAKAIALLVKSPYKEKLSAAALFLRAVSQMCKQMPNLFQPRFGDGVMRMNRLVELAPRLDPSNLEQVAALPLSSRIKVDPWSNITELAKPPSTRPLSPREKMPFEMMPVMLTLEPREDLQPQDDLVWLTAERSYEPAWPARK
jgi:hypothetical protein